MKMQFAFGNPRRGKRKHKKVAKRRKKLKTKSVKLKTKRIVKMAKRKRHGRRRKNPEAYVLRKGKKIVGRSRVIATDREAKEHLATIHKVQKEMKDKANTLTPKKRKALRAQWLKAKKELTKRQEELKTVGRHMEDGAQASKYDLAKKGAKMAKKKRKKKSKKVRASKKRAKKVTKRAKRRKGGKRRRKMSAAAKRAFVARMKAARKGSSKKSSKKRRTKRRKHSKRRSRRRMVTHKHASSVRHIKKGQSFRFKSKARKGKRSISISGRVKINPFRSNPMKQVSAQMKKALGLDAAELGSLALGGVLVPIVNAGIGKIPGMSTVVSKINQYAGAQATGSIVPILAGAVLNLAADKASGKSKEYLKMAGEGLAAAGVIGLVMGLSQKYVAPALGLNGINYTPSLGIMPQLNGINYTPNRGLSGINYTPNRGMGIMPQLNGVDFGSANYGGGGGSKEARTQRSDFGADWSEDSEPDYQQTDDDSLSSSMN
jgi:hypothetical protein